MKDGKTFNDVWDEVAKALPIYWEIHVSIDGHGGYNVELEDPTGDSVDFSSNFENLEQMVLDAVSYAQKLEKEADDSHTPNCSYWNDRDQADCTCGLEWRKKIEVEQQRIAAASVEIEKLQTTILDLREEVDEVREMLRETTCLNLMMDVHNSSHELTPILAKQIANNNRYLNVQSP